MSKPRIFFDTLGCPKNLVDSETICGDLCARGWALAGSAGEADVCVINTCSFIRKAREEAYAEIRKVSRAAAGRPVIVTGCLLKSVPSARLRTMFPTVAAFISPEEYKDFGSLLARAASFRNRASGRPSGDAALVTVQDRKSSQFPKRVLFTPSWTAYLKISEGCSNNCSYCTIPTIRGPLRSRDEGSVIAEAKSLAGSGVREINLVAQDLTSWGREQDERGLFPALLKKLARVRGDFWLRLLYLHPKRITRDLISAICGEEKVCSYIDMPVQHISDRVLRLMNRGVARRDIEAVIENVRSRRDPAALRTSLIVGFPGETDRDFGELLSFVRSARFDRLGVFTYSRESGTRAALLGGHLPEKVKRERRDAVMALQARVAEEKNREKEGHVLSVLVEGPAQGGGFSSWGRSEFEAPDIDPIIYLRSSGNLLPGRFARVIIDGAAGYDLLASVPAKGNRTTGTGTI